MNGRRLYWVGFCLWSAFGLVLQVKAQESGDGFTSSDRTMLQEIHTRTAAIKNDTTTIRQDVTAIRNDVGDISDAVDDLLDYASSHSDSLHNIYQDTQHIRTFVDDIVADINGIYGNSTYLPTIHTDLVSVRQQLQYLRGDISDIPDEVTQINGHLLNIDRETTESSDYLQSIDYYVKYLATFVEQISTNGASSVDISSISNILSQISSPVDLSIVTNFLAAQSFPFFTATFFPDFGARYGELMRDMLGYDSDYEFTADDYATVFGSSQMGFFMSMLVQALFPNPDDIFDSIDTITPNLFAYAWENFGYGEQDYNTALWVDWPYTIFDAYNTLGLGVLTNQMITVSNVLGEVRDLLSSNVAQVVKVNTSIGYDDSQDEDLELEHGDDSRLPEWEERYQGHLADWTNSYYYESIFQGSYSRMAEASNVVNDFFTQLDQSPGDFHHTLTWSGLSFGRDNPIGGWDLNVTISKDDPNYADVRSFTNGVFSVSMAFLNLCIVAYFMRRIYGNLMKSPLL